ncbi:MAG TPA: hypothetical protein VIS71_08600 [Terrimicrobium sp.]
MAAKARQHDHCDQSVASQAGTTPLVPLQKFTEAEIKLKEANEEIRGLEVEAKRLAKVLEETQKLKDKHEAAKVELANLPAADAFEESVGEAVEAMKPIPSVVCDALYYHFRGELLPAPRAGFSNTEDRWEEIHSAEEADYCLVVSNGADSVASRFLADLNPTATAATWMRSRL